VSAQEVLRLQQQQRAPAPSARRVTSSTLDFGLPGGEPIKGFTTEPIEGANTALPAPDEVTKTLGGIVTPPPQEGPLLGSGGFLPSESPGDLSPFDITSPNPEDPQRGPGGLVPGEFGQQFLPPPPSPVDDPPAPVLSQPPVDPLSPDVEEEPVLGRRERIQRRTLLGSP
jgi:hypothetical protein